MAEKLFYTMGEVAEMFDVNQSLIRYWESQFKVLRPKRNKKGNRLFTQEDIKNLKLIYHLVKERGMTLEGAKKALRGVPADHGNDMNRDAELMERLQRIRSLLEEVREDLKSEAPEAGNTVVGTTPASPTKRRAVVQIDESGVAASAGGSESSEHAEGVPAASRRTARRPRRKKEESENKELFAFYEQSLF